jgi:hypothetical protein
MIGASGTTTIVVTGVEWVPLIIVGVGFEGLPFLRRIGSILILVESQF